MRMKALVLMSMLPLALAVAPRGAHAQRVYIGECRGRFGSTSRLSDCSPDLAERIRAAHRASEWARADARERAERARADARVRAETVRETARLRMWERTTTPRVRLHADELRTRLHDRLESRAFTRRGPNYRRW